MAIDYRDEATDVDLAQLGALFDEAGWGARRAVLAELVAGSRFVVSAWEGPLLVGFGRAFSDGATGAYLTDVVVRASHQRRGIGRAICERILARTGALKVTLHAEPHLHAFYASLGFVPATNVLVRRPV